MNPYLYKQFALKTLYSATLPPPPLFTLKFRLNLQKIFLKETLSLVSKRTKGGKNLGWNQLFSASGRICTGKQWQHTPGSVSEAPFWKLSLHPVLFLEAAAARAACMDWSQPRMQPVPPCTAHNSCQTALGERQSTWWAIPRHACQGAAGGLSWSVSSTDRAGFPPHRSGVTSSLREGGNTMQERGEADLGFKSFLSASTPIPCPQAFPAPCLCLPVHPTPPWFQQQQFSLSGAGKESLGYLDLADGPAIPHLLHWKWAWTGFQRLDSAPHAHPQPMLLYTERQNKWLNKG